MTNSLDEPLQAVLESPVLTGTEGAQLDVVEPMPFLPTMTGNGLNPTYKNGDDWGMVQMALF